MCMRIVDPEQPKGQSERAYRNRKGDLFLLCYIGGKYHTVCLSNHEFSATWRHGQETMLGATSGLEPVEIGTLLEVVA